MIDYAAGFLRSNLIYVAIAFMLVGFYIHHQRLRCSNESSSCIFRHVLR